MTQPRRLATPTTRAGRAVLTGAVGATAAALLTACGGLSEPVDTGAATGGGDAAAAETVLRLSHVYEPTHPVETCGVTAIQEELEGSGLAVESYPAAQLGNETESLEQVAGGGLDLAVAGPSFLGVYHEPAAVLDAAYLFEDVDHFVETTEGQALADIHEELRQSSGIRVLSNWYYGTRHVTSNTPIGSPEDLAGVKLRTPNAPLYLTNIEVMGGTATPMALDEVYLALQQGTLDAQENPVPTIESAAFFEVQDYINLTGHMIQGVHVVTNDGVYESLTEGQRTALDEALAAARDAVRECIETAEQETLDEWAQDGTMTVNEDVDREAFAQRAREQLPSRVPWGDLYTEIQASR